MCNCDNHEKDISWKPTPKMIEAGAKALDTALFQLDWQSQPIGLGNCRAVAVAVFTAMRAKHA